MLLPILHFRSIVFRWILIAATAWKIALTTDDLPEIFVWLSSKHFSSKTSYTKVISALLTVIDFGKMQQFTLRPPNWLGFQFFRFKSYKMTFQRSPIVLKRKSIYWIYGRPSPSFIERPLLKILLLWIQIHQIQFSKWSFYRICITTKSYLAAKFRATIENDSFG